MSLIDRNSKLFQKFMQGKAKQTLQGSCENHGFQSKMKNRDSEEIGKIEKLCSDSGQEDSNMKIREQNNENINTENMQGRINKPTNEVKLDKLLKKQLEKQRITITKKSEVVSEPIESLHFEVSSKYSQDGFSQVRNEASPQQFERETNYESKHWQEVSSLKEKIYQLRLQEDYLRKENSQLKSKLEQENHKNIKFKQEVEEYSEQITELQTKIHNLEHELQENHRSKESTQNQEMIMEISKLKQQNYLAKDYLYKLTLKLYASEKENQQLKEEIAKRSPVNNISQSKHSSNIESYMMLSSQLNETKTSRNRQFSSSREISKMKKMYQTQTVEISKFQPIQESKPSKYKRIAQINKQLQELQDLKIFNGKNRRRKIELQRQLEQIYKS